VLAAGLVLIALAVVLFIHPWQEQEKWDLTPGGQQRQCAGLSLNRVKDLPSYTGKGGFFTTVGVVYGPYQGTGVLLSDLCNLAGGIKRMKFS